MRRFALGFAMLVAGGLPVAADPLEGIWQTEPDDGAFAYVTIAPCGSAYCGHITRTFRDGEEYQSENIGRQIVIGMVPRGDGRYRGQVWRPSNNKVYKGDATLSGDALRLRGCVGICTALTSASQTWVRIE